MTKEREAMGARPLTMSVEREADVRRKAAGVMTWPTFGANIKFAMDEVLAELDAERAAHRATLEAHRLDVAALTAEREAHDATRATLGSVTVQWEAAVSEHVATWAQRDELLAALEDARFMLRAYHKGEAPGHLDACEMPDNCAHCLLCRQIDAAIAKARAAR